MWVRKRIEALPLDLMAALLRCLAPDDPTYWEDYLRKQWSDGASAVFLSVRSGFDLLLSQFRWPAGSEVLMTGLTIQDMPRLVEAHGYVPIGIDIDPLTCNPVLEQLQQSITPATRAIVVAHLFGGLCEMDDVIEIARRHDLLVIEDCAQAYVGQNYQGDPRADVSMFSFGPIKTNTSLAGAVFVVRDPARLAQCRSAHAKWPRQTRWAYAGRILKYLFVQLLSCRPVVGAIASVSQWLGRDHDALAIYFSRSFPGPGFFQNIRQQPAAPLLWLMNRRFKRFDSATVQRRKERGDGVVAALAGQVLVVGSAMKRQTWWLLPVLAEDPLELVRRLRRAGFDATNHCSLAPVGSSGDTSRRLSQVESLLQHIVFVPFDLAIPDGELKRLTTLIASGGLFSWQSKSLHAINSTSP